MIAEIQKEIQKIKEKTIVDEPSKTTESQDQIPIGKRKRGRPPIDPELKKEKNRIRARIYKRKISGLSPDEVHTKPNKGRKKEDISDEERKRRHYEATNKWKLQNKEYVNETERLRLKQKRVLQNKNDVIVSEIKL
jgi:hypothetical protein